MSLVCRPPPQSLLGFLLKSGQGPHESAIPVDSSGWVNDLSCLVPRCSIVALGLIVSLGQNQEFGLEENGIIKSSRTDNKVEWGHYKNSP